MLDYTKLMKQNSTVKALPYASFDFEILHHKSNRLAYQQSTRKLSPQAKSSALTVGKKLISESLEDLKQVASYFKE